MDVTDLPPEKHIAGKLSVIFSDGATVICEWDVSKFLRSYNESSKPSSSSPSVKIKSPTFSHSLSTEWCMEFRARVHGQSLRFCLLSSENNQDFEAEVKASILVNGIVKHVYTIQNLTIYGRSPTCSWYQDYNIWEDLRNKEFDLKIQGEVYIPSVTVQSHGTKVLCGDPRIVADDLGLLLDSGHLSDVTLCAGACRIKAHRFLLSARSAVFAAMLRGNTREAQSGRIEIPDVDPDTLREVLRYMYTGKVPCLFKMADKLLVAADKYDLQKLKELCEVELAKNLTTVNAAATAVIALKHSCSLLKPCALKFIKSSIFPVLKSDGWTDALLQQPEIVVEMSRLIGNLKE